jgi:hypothetical protein
VDRSGRRRRLRGTLVDGGGTGGWRKAGTVRLSHDTPNADYRELEQDIEIGDEDASDSVRLAALVAYTAEALKDNSVVTDRDLTLEEADNGVDDADTMEDPRRGGHGGRAASVEQSVAH